MPDHDPRVAALAEAQVELRMREAEILQRRMHRAHERVAQRLACTAQFAAEIDDAKAQAEFRDGVLRLTLWKKESSQVKRLSIH